MEQNDFKLWAKRKSLKVVRTHVKAPQLHAPKILSKVTKNIRKFVDPLNSEEFDSNLFTKLLAKVNYSYYIIQ